MRFCICRVTSCKHVIKEYPSLVSIVGTEEIITMDLVVLVDPKIILHDSSYVNEVIRAVLDSFLQKDFTRTKAQKAQRRNQPKAQKHKDANRQISDFFPLRSFLHSLFLFAVSVSCFFVLVKFLNKEV